MSSDIIPMQSPYVVGIDLGTSNSSISDYHRDHPKTLMLSGAKAIPSVVWFRSKDKTRMVVGKSAKKSMLITPDEVFASTNGPRGQESFDEMEEMIAKHGLITRTIVVSRAMD